MNARGFYSMLFAGAWLPPAPSLAAGGANRHWRVAMAALSLLGLMIGSQASYAVRVVQLCWRQASNGIFASTRVEKVPPINSLSRV